MGKATGFLDYSRKANEKISPLDRIKNFEEFYKYNSKEEREKQAARCMNCGVPFCASALELKGMVTGCPLHNLIPEWNDNLYNKNYAHALSRLLKTNPFPEFTGRVCPALCEKACINGMDGEAVTIHDNELFLIEEGFKTGKLTAKIPSARSGKKVAVIGSGPAGLAVAEKLNKRGHLVTIFERDDNIGGLLMYGIPNMKLDKKVILRRVNLMQEEGVTFAVNKDLGKNLSLEELEKEYDAIVLCCGAKKARDINLDTKGIEGVHYAVDFLTSTTKSILNSDDNYISAKDKNVVIIGGGDTGNDCVGTSIRHGAKSVVQLEMMKRPPVTRTCSNPWPEWPKVLNTDYGQEEAIAVFGQDPRVFETTVKNIIAKDGVLKEVETVKIEFKDGKMVPIVGSEEIIKADLLLIAAGFVGYEEYSAPSVDIPKKDNRSYSTNVNKVFACGDMKRGQSLVVWAISDGIKCAKEVDKFLIEE